MCVCGGAIFGEGEREWRKLSLCHRLESRVSWLTPSDFGLAVIGAAEPGRDPAFLIQTAPPTPSNPAVLHWETVVLLDCQRLQATPKLGGVTWHAREPGAWELSLGSRDD